MDIMGFRGLSTRRSLDHTSGEDARVVVEIQLNPPPT
jgi:hypothetical protein